MNKNCWQSCGRTDNVVQEPRKVTILGQRLVVFRDSQERIVVVDEHLVSQCDNVYSLSKKSYSVAEKYGFVWVFLGDVVAEYRPPLPSFPGWDADNFRAVYGEYVWKANVCQVVTQSLDPIQALRKKDTSCVSSNTLEALLCMGEWGIGVHLILNSSHFRGFWEDSCHEVRNTHVFSGFSAPNVSFVQLTVRGKHAYLYRLAVPIDEETTITYWVVLRDFLASADADFHRKTMMFLHQNIPIGGQQCFGTLPSKLQKDIQVRVAALQEAYRIYGDQLDISKQCSLSEENVQVSLLSQYKNTITDIWLFFGEQFTRGKRRAS